MENIKAAVIGTGFIGPAHIEALMRIGYVDVVAIASIEPAVAKNLAQKFKIPKVYANWEELVRDKSVQVVHNCTPNNLHFKINKAALKAGKHVVSEKPLTMTAKESSELLRVARESKRVHAVNFNYRFYPLTQHARQLVRKGDVGKIYMVHGHYLQDWLYYDSDYNWRIDPSMSGASRAVADIGSHWCDLVQFISGCKIERVFADLLTVHKKRKRPLREVASFKGKEESTTNPFEAIPIETEDAGLVMLQFDNGARGQFVVSQISAGRKNRLWFEIDGSKQAVAWDQEEPNQLWIGHREKGNEIIIKDPSLLDEKVRQYAHYPGGHPEGYPDGPKNLFMKVYDFIRQGSDPLRDETEFPTFADGHWENLIIEAILKSNKSKKWVEVK
jgi:predicted dehydrogenase